MVKRSAAVTVFTLTPIHSQHGKLGWSPLHFTLARLPVLTRLRELVWKHSEMRLVHLLLKLYALDPEPTERKWIKLQPWREPTAHFTSWTFTRLRFISPLSAPQSDVTCNALHLMYFQRRERKKKWMSPTCILIDCCFYSMMKLDSWSSVISQMGSICWLGSVRMTGLKKQPPQNMECWDYLFFSSGSPSLLHLALFFSRQPKKWLLLADYFLLDIAINMHLFCDCAANCFPFFFA